LILILTILGRIYRLTPDFRHSARPASFDTNDIYKYLNYLTIYAYFLWSNKLHPA